MQDTISVHLFIGFLSIHNTSLSAYFFTYSFKFLFSFLFPFLFLNEELNWSRLHASSALCVFRLFSCGLVASGIPLTVISRKKYIMIDLSWIFESHLLHLDFIEFLFPIDSWTLFELSQTLFSSSYILLVSSIQVLGTFLRFSQWSTPVPSPSGFAYYL